MVTSIARQSVILKCLRKKSVLLGNYEFYYLAGLMNKCFGLSCREDMKPLELLEYITGQLDNISPADDEEEYLLKLVKVFEPLDSYDEQMVELFRWGASEDKLWQVETDR